MTLPLQERPTTATRTFPVIEVFGPTVQGEGVLAGAPTHFIRFGGCDYRCRWCDSMHAVEPEQVRAHAEKLTEEQILSRIAGLPPGPHWVTLSGGNPALMPLDNLIGDLHADGYLVAVETQGTAHRPWLDDVDCLTVSPKPPSSGMADRTERDLPRFLERVRPPTDADAMKIVIFDDVDLDWAAATFDSHPAWPAFLSCGTDPPAEGETHAETLMRISDRYRLLCEAVAARRDLAHARVLPQLHVLAWAHARGV